MACAFQLETFLEQNLENWIFGGHCEERHINCPVEKLQSRIGKYDEENGKLIHASTTFVDPDNGDSVIDMIKMHLLQHEQMIVNWMQHGQRNLMYLFLPIVSPIKGIGYSLYHKGELTTKYYILILSKEHSKYFEVVTAYPKISI